MTITAPDYSYDSRPVNESCHCGRRVQGQCSATGALSCPLGYQQPPPAAVYGCVVSQPDRDGGGCE